MAWVLPVCEMTPHHRLWRSLSFSGDANPFVLRTFPLAGESPRGEGEVGRCGLSGVSGVNARFFISLRYTLNDGKEQFLIFLQRKGKPCNSRGRRTQFTTIKSSIHAVGNSLFLGFPKKLCAKGLLFFLLFVTI